MTSLNGHGRPAPEARRPTRLHFLVGSRETIAGAVYGTVIVMATIAAGSKGGLHPWELVAAMVATVLVLWVAHVYAASLEASIHADHGLRWQEFTAVARHELSIPLAAVGPGAALVLGGLGVMREASAVWLAMDVGLFVLAVQGLRYARVERLGPLGTFVAVAINVGLGLAIVALKAATSH